MKKRRLLLAALVLGASCLSSACKDEPSADEGPGGAFLKSNSGDPKVLWQAEPVPPPAQAPVASLLENGERAVFVDMDARGAFGGQLRRGDYIDVMLEIGVEKVIHEAPSAQPADDESAEGKPADGKSAEPMPTVRRIGQETVDEPAEPSPPAKSTSHAVTMLLQHKSVLGSAYSPPRASQERGSWSVAIAATPQEARLLNVARKRGHIYTLARRSSDFGLVSRSPMTLKKGLEALGEMNQARKKQAADPVGDEKRFDAEQMTQRVRTGMRAIALPMHVPAVVARQLRPGARVDISGTFPIDRDELLVDDAASRDFLDMTLIQNARVLAASDGRLGEERQRKARASTAQTEPVVVVEVSPDEAKLLALSAARGEVAMTLRAPNDTEVGPIRRVMGRRLLEDLEVINKKRETRLRRRKPRRKQHDVKIYRPHTAQKKHGAIKIWGGHDSKMASSRGAKLLRGVKMVPSSPSTTESTPSPEHKAEASASTAATENKASATARTRDSAPHPSVPAEAPSTGVRSTKDAPRSTFALDVDTSSYTLARRYLQDGELPPADGVRVEEFVNYFDYDNPWPKEQPFAISVEGAPSPFWRSKRHYLLRIGVQAQKEAPQTRKPVNLVLLLDTSSSMRGGDRLGMMQEALIELVDNLKAGDTVAIVGYGDGAHEILPRVQATKKATIIRAIKAIEARGATDMQAGMQWAYRLMRSQVGTGAENRVIVLSDGDPNLGAKTAKALLETVDAQRQKGVTLTAVAFGKQEGGDGLMEQLADQGDGNSFFIDSADEAKRLFGERLMSTVLSVARDVKAQVEFDPKVVARYRRIGYDNRTLTDAQWHDPSTDAGEIGPGHRVTVLYEVELADGAAGGPLGTVTLRYKPVDGNKELQIGAPLERSALHETFEGASADLRFAASVAGFAEVLGRTALGQYLSLEAIEDIAEDATKGDAQRQEMVKLIERARKLQDAESKPTDAQKQARPSEEARIE